MVNFLRKPLYKKVSLAVFFLTVFFIFGCDVDFLGVFASTDLNTRLNEKDNFSFISESERNLTLGEDFSFLVLTDTHIKNGNSFGLENLKNVITNNPKIKFIVVTGDITETGDRNDLKKFLDIVSDFGIPCYPVIGNHDVFFGNWSVWKEHIGSTRYKININGGSTTLFMLDSANSFFGDDQLNWLERELKNTHGNIFVFTHVNLFPSGIVRYQFSDTKERARLVNILRNKCNIMFMGHTHGRSINEVGRVKYITVEDFVISKTYCLVTVNGSNISYTFGKL